MAASLLSPGRIKHVVPWKTRDDFLSVYWGLYHNDENLQELAIRKIAVWKSRAGSKLSVAIESSGMLTQACLDHARTLREGALLHKEALLRASYSLALIRFVNHVTEKGQTKAVAQPVHLVAREFGIPEWIVRLRHDATHSSLPSLSALVAGSRWALHYLQEHFWKHQMLESVVDKDDPDPVSPRTVKMAVIRRTFYDFQKARYQELNAQDKEKEECSVRISSTMKALQKYLTQNRLRFIKCFLEDGILISTEEQLTAFGVSAEDLTSQLPPTIPLEIAEFWRPLLKKLNSCAAIPLLVQTAVFMVTSGEGLRNYQLVAWVAYFLSLQADPNNKNKKKRRRKQEVMFKVTTALPVKMMLSACLQNVNLLTAYLLKHLADKESLGAENYNKLMKLLEVHSQTAGIQMSSDECDSDTIYTVEDIKRAREKHSPSQEITSSTVHNIQSNICGNSICWQICTDIVDWASVPLGTLPKLSNEDDSGDDEDDDDPDISADRVKSEGRDSSHSNDNDDYISRRKTSRKRRTSDHDEEDSDDSGSGTSPKRSMLTVTDSGLL
ncbi:hypothetical protein BsWGS_27820 [Bradybaena similaris]